MTDAGDKIKVTVNTNFSDELIDKIRAVSPRLLVTRHYPDVPDSVYAESEVLFTSRRAPEPDQVPRLRWIQLSSAGVEHVLKEKIAKAEDIVLTSASGMHTRHMAQFGMMMILAFHFKLPLMLERQRQGQWSDDRANAFAPQDLHHMTLGIAGYGSIGRELARLAKNVGMTVLASKQNAMHPAENPGEYSPAGTGDPAGDLPDRIYPAEALATMAKECDYLVLLMPLTPQTRHTVNAAVLNAMPPTAVLINLARGAVVDEAALIEALEHHKIGGAGLDVFETEPLPADSPFWKLDNVIISPHTAGNTATYNDKAADLFIENLKLYLEKKPLLNRINREKGY